MPEGATGTSQGWPGSRTTVWRGVGGGWKVLRGAGEAKLQVSLPYRGLAGPLSSLCAPWARRGKAECIECVGFPPGISQGSVEWQRDQPDP